MYNFVFSRCSKYAWLASLSLLLCACSPRFDWREVTVVREQPYQVLMPAKPASMSRVVQLAGQQLSMHMLAAEAGQISFAVGSVQVADPGQAGLIAKAMREGMLANICVLNPNKYKHWLTVTSSPAAAVRKASP